LNGFTLLEMLFVMFVIGLLTGLVAPRFSSRIDQIEQRSQLLDIEDQLRQLPRRARLATRAVELPKDIDSKKLGDGRPVMLLPQRWSVKADPPLLVAANGACSRARLAIEYPESSRPPSYYDVAELSCELSIPER
jgi:prepilin-type N-terminal cleavage/methylation domain-containing protein